METIDRDMRTGRPRLEESVAEDSLCLVAGDPYAVGLSGEVAVEVLDGAIWVTLEGDELDHVLSRGERHELRGRGLLVVESLTPFAHLRITGPGMRG